jgi:putative transposase
MVTINRLADIIADIAGIEIVKRHVPRPQGVRGRNSDNARLREVLGWAPKIPLEEGLAVNEALRQQEQQIRGRQAEPSAAIIDSQSVKTTESGGERGYDAGKKVNGRKRHIVVDTVGNLLIAVVHAADSQDRDGAKLVLGKLTEAARMRLQKIWADGGYRGKLVDWVQENLAIVLEIVARAPNQKGSQVLPRRWVVERTFVWLSRYRRLSKDYERCTASSEGVVNIASIHTMMRQIAAAS